MILRNSLLLLLLNAGSGMAATHQDNSADPEGIGGTGSKPEPLQSDEEAEGIGGTGRQMKDLEHPDVFDRPDIFDRPDLDYQRIDTPGTDAGEASSPAETDTHSGQSSPP